jgi:regulator of sigma E protease
VAFAGIVWAVGRPVGESDVTTVIGYVMPDSSAAKVGLQAGDKILAVDGKKVSRFVGMNNSVMWNVVRSEGATVPVEFERNGTVRTVQVTPYIATTEGWRRKGTRQLLIAPAETAIIE